MMNQMQSNDTVSVFQILSILVVAMGILLSMFKKKVPEIVIPSYTVTKKRKIDHLYEDESEKINIDPMFKMRVIPRTASKDRIHSFEGF